MWQLHAHLIWGFSALTLKLTFSLLARQVLRSVSLEMLTPDIDILAIHQIRGKYRQLSPELRRYIEANRLPQIYCVHYS